MKEAYLACKEIGIDLALMLAGLFGGVAFLSKPNEMNRAQKMLVLVSGLSSANYLTPIFLWITHLPDNFGYGMGFIVGYTGLKSVEFLITKYKLRQDKK